MQYPHTHERSTEVLRQALPLMSRQAAALDPMSYALWYAYVAGDRVALRTEVDQMLARHGKLDAATTAQLYERHVATFDAGTARRMGEHLQQLAASLSDNAARAGDHTQQYGHALERAAAALSTDPIRQAAGGPTGPANLVEELLVQTQQMRSHMARLQRELAASQREIEQLRSEVERAREESLVDTLTGLANRRAFDRRLGECLMARQAAAAQPQAQATPHLLLADLDHFKRINDTYGHGFGDQVLRAVAQLLKASAPSRALAARVGGEEFALLLPQAEPHQALALAERLRAAVAANHIRRKGQEEAHERVTLSLGLARLRDDDSAQAWFERADRALYAAKAAGRDRVVGDAAA